MKEAHDLATCVVSPSSQACIDEEDVRGGRKGKILTLGATNSSWRKIDVINDNKPATLFGAERINDKKMKEEANVLATASVMSAPASLLSCYSSSCNLRFVSSSADHNNNKKCPLIVYKNVSSFVENIIPLTSLLG